MTVPPVEQINLMKPSSMPCIFARGFSSKEILCTKPLTLPSLSAASDQPTEAISGEVKTFDATLRVSVGAAMSPSV
jgi:hypothetical protein